MKKILLAASLLLATAAFAHASDEATELPDNADLGILAHLLAPANVARGMTSKHVQAQLGAPDTTLAANIWVYWNFKAKDNPRVENADTLIVIFENERVQRVRLTDGKPVRAFIAQRDVKAAAAKTSVAAK